MTHSRDHRPTDRDSGFTLVEMLVVLTIILILAALSVALIPTVGEKQRVGNGASQLQSWLAYARMIALRDKVPTGIRLLPPAQPLVNQVGFTLMTQVQYIQQPDPLSGGYVTLGVQQGQPPGTSTLGPPAPPLPGPPDFYGGFGAAPQQFWAVQPGDYLEISGSSSVFVVLALVPNKKTNPPTCNQLIVAGQPVTTIPPTPDYKIVRQPRPKAGEGVLSLPDNVAIDLTTNLTYPWYSANPPQLNPLTQTMDILFAPNGSISNSTSGNDMIQLWLRDRSEDLFGPAPPLPPQKPVPGTAYYATFSGEQALVTIYVRTGMVAGNRIDMTLDPQPQAPYTNTVRYLHPYSYTNDGGPSGL
jgi:prepilin-type N-terminal cleavage/methylation domain-containing protein